MVALHFVITFKFLSKLENVVHFSLQERKKNVTLDILIQTGSNNIQNVDLNSHDIQFGLVGLNGFSNGFEFFFIQVFYFAKNGRKSPKVFFAVD